MRSAIFFFLGIAGAAITNPTNTTDPPHTRQYFYSGGQYVTNTAGEHTWTDQLYVEQLTPLAGITKENPIIFIHGQAQTGTVSLYQHLFPTSVPSACPHYLTRPSSGGSDDLIGP